jgi:hypothetical protein
MSQAAIHAASSFKKVNPHLYLSLAMTTTLVKFGKFLSPIHCVTETIRAILLLQLKLDERIHPIIDSDK